MIALVGPAYILFSLCCIKYHEVQHMRDIPPRVSEEHLPWVQVTPYHPHNSVNLPRHPTPVAFRRWLRSSVYTLYNNCDNCPPCLIPFEQRNVIDSELPSAGHYRDNLSRYFIAISFLLSFYRDKIFRLVIDLSVSRYFCSKISDNR